MLLSHGPLSIGQASLLSSSRVLPYNCDFGSKRDLIKLCKEEQLDKVLEVVHGINQQGFVVPRDIIYCLLQRCTTRNDLEVGRQISSLMFSNGLDAISVLGDHLIRLFSICGSLVEANRAFHRVAKPTVYTWNAIISAHAKLGKGNGAVLLYIRMQQEGINADKVTFLCILKACGNTAALEQGKLIHDTIIQVGLESDVVVGNALIDMYAKCKCLEEARKIFDKLPNQDVISWSAMIIGYAQHGQGLPAVELSKKMRQHSISPDKVLLLCIVKACGMVGAIEQGRLVHYDLMRHAFESDIVIGSNLIDMYVKCGCLEEACRVFKKLPNGDVALWGTIISGYACHGKFRSALQYLEDMQQLGLKPDDLIFTSILTACSHAGLLEEGHEYFRCMKEDHGITPSIEHYNCIVDMLSRAGSLKEAESLLETMPIFPDIVSWRCLLTSCRVYGSLELGRRCFNEATRLDPTDASGYVLMINIYADAQMWEDVNRLQELRKIAAAPKKPGSAWIELNNKMQEFMVCGKSHMQIDEIDFRLNLLIKVLRDEGLVPQL